MHNLLSFHLHLKDWRPPPPHQEGPATLKRLTTCSSDVLRKIRGRITGFLVGGVNPFEKYQSNWESSPNRGENKKNETTTQIYMDFAITIRPDSKPSSWLLLQSSVIGRLNNQMVKLLQFQKVQWFIYPLVI